MRPVDYALVGGGLQNGLMAAMLAHFRPGARVLLVDRAARVGSGHTWCFHDADLPSELRGVVAPFVAREWPGYDVEFPGHSRSIDGKYSCISAESFERALTQLFQSTSGYSLRLATPVVNLAPHHIDLANGERIEARSVIDARGPGRLEEARIAGYQKFLGMELSLSSPLDMARPLLMDARVPQLDGYRFVYVLPFSSRRVLIEDTYFSDRPELDREALRARVLGYAAEHGMDVAEVVREEVGVLPLPARMKEPRSEAPLRAGYQGGWFHPTTGYSFPVAARLAALVARTPEAELGRALEECARSHAVQTRFCTFLNRLLFGGFEDGDRRNVFERFYRLPEPTIARFYALRMTALDRGRVLCGRPPRGISLRRFLHNDGSWGGESAHLSGSGKALLSETGTRGNHP